MIYRVDWNNPKAVIGCGVIRTVLGVVILSPVVVGLFKAIGGLLILLGLIVLAMGIGSWALGTRRGINWPCLICGDVPRVGEHPLKVQS